MTRFPLYIVVAIIGLVLLIHVALGHEAKKGWEYPWECCHDLDCSEISPERVKPVAGGYMVDGRFHVLQKDVRVSPDGVYHACFPQPDNLKCFFAPPMGF